MGHRRSIEIEGFHHNGQPIPAASRVGNLVMTSGIHGMDPRTRTVPDSVEDQARLMFENLGRILAAAGAGFEDVAKITVFAKAPEVRGFVNEHWLRLYPDPHNRPARHTLQYDHLPGNLAVQCDAMAFVTDGRERAPQF